MSLGFVCRAVAVMVFSSFARRRSITATQHLSGQTAAHFEDRLELVRAALCSIRRGRLSIRAGNAR
jgi:hypothetical protein